MLDVHRREIITLLGGAAIWPMAATAQQLRKTPRIGVLLAGTPASFSTRAKAFLEGLQDRRSWRGGWVGDWGIAARAEHLRHAGEELLRRERLRQERVTTGRNAATQQFFLDAARAHQYWH